MSEYGKYPLGYYEDNWEGLLLSESEFDRLCDRCDSGDVEGACAEVDRAYERVAVWPEVLTDE